MTTGIERPPVDLEAIVIAMMRPIPGMVASN
jgi:hypothetical protein